MRRPLIWFVVASAVTWLAILLVAGSALALSTGDGGWLWQNPLPQGNNLEAVDAIDSIWRFPSHSTGPASRGSPAAMPHIEAT
jgi:hypothetical protein